jgi:hypothetical protein
MRLLLTALLATMLTEPIRAQTCLHGPDESDRQRRRVNEAIEFIRDVHAAEARAYRERDTYVPTRDAISVAQVPTGFLARVTADRWSYAIIVKDGLDPCGFALVSDQDGVIYAATPTTGDADEGADAPALADREP